MTTLIFRRKTPLLVAFVMLVVAIGTMTTPSPATAATCGKNEQQVSLPVDQGGTTCIPINERNANLEENPIFFYLRNILIFLAGGVGLAVVGGIVAGSYMYITARASAAQTQKGQEMIVNSVIGLLLFIFMYAILQFLIPGGIFK